MIFWRDLTPYCVNLCKDYLSKCWIVQLSDKEFALIEQLDNPFWCWFGVSDGVQVCRAIDLIAFAAFLEMQSKLLNRFANGNGNEDVP